MKNSLTLRATLVLALGLTLSAAHAQTVAMGDKAGLKAGKAQVAKTYSADKAACKALSSNAKDICMEEAKAKEKNALADMNYGYSGKPADATKVSETRAHGHYAVAREKCDDQAGNAKDLCVTEAKAVQTKALADAKMVKTVGEARKDGAQEKRDADYKVAAEKCESMAGDAKTSCVTAAKLKFGKT